MRFQTIRDDSRCVVQAIPPEERAESIQMMVQRGLTIIPFTTTNPTKQAAIQTLQAGFEHGTIKILDDPILIGELQSFEGNRTPTGAWKYAAPDGMHDDCVMALAITWNGLAGGVWDVY